MTKKKHDVYEGDDVADVPKVETFLSRMRAERDQLAERLTKLDGFVGSVAFNDVDQEERERMLGQRTAMSHYRGILEARIAYHEARGVK